MSRFDPDLPRHVLNARLAAAGRVSLPGDDLAIPPPPIAPARRPRRPSATRTMIRDVTWGLVLAWAVAEVLLWFGGA